MLGNANYCIVTENGPMFSERWVGEEEVGGGVRAGWYDKRKG